MLGRHDTRHENGNETNVLMKTYISDEDNVPYQVANWIGNTLDQSSNPMKR